MTALMALLANYTANAVTTAEAAAAAARAASGRPPAPQNYFHVPGRANATRYKPPVNPFCDSTPSPLPNSADAAFKGLLNKDRWNADSKAADAHVWITKLMSMCGDQGLSGPQFMGYMKHAFESGLALTWLHSIHGSLGPGNEWTPELFRERFLTHFAGQVRDPHAMALSQLIHGRIQQGSNTAEEYSERFLAVSRHVPDISGPALCQCYIAGLHPDLKSDCILTLTNTEWTNIYDLMHHAASVAMRALLTSTQVAPPLGPSPRKRVSFHIDTPFPDPEERWNKTQRLAIASQLEHFTDQEPTQAIPANLDPPQGPH